MVGDWPVKFRLDLFDVKKKTMSAGQFVVVEDEREAVLGYRDAEKFGLIKRVNGIFEAKEYQMSKEQFMEKYKKAFDGVGKFPGKCNIKLEEGSIPQLKYKKRIPLAIQDKLNEELRLMEERGIIGAVDYPTDTINNMQVVGKADGSLRICLDP